MKWISLSGLGIALLLVAVVSSLLLWLAASYSRVHPLNLDRYLPSIQRYLAGAGLPMTIGHLEVFYDESPIIRATDIAIVGSHGEAGVYVEQAAIKLANRRIFALQASPKVIEAKGVTLRIVRDENGVGVYGLERRQARSDGGAGMVEWLNGLAFSSVWARLKDVKIDKVNLLLRDKILGTEWVLENGRLAMTRYPDDGERGTLVASVRRLSGVDRLGLKEGMVMPVLVSFDHRHGDKVARLSAKFDQTEVGLVADYLPEQLRDLLRAQGSVEIGTDIMPGNSLSRPWVTLRLANVVVQPPQGFSKPLEFPRLTMTASYSPSPTDVLEIRDIALLSRRGNIWSGKGTVSQLTTDPVLDVSVDSEAGDVQGIFDFFPDQVERSKKALDFLRPNLKDAAYRELHAVFKGRLADFPHCGDACGTVQIDARIPQGRVKFLPELSEAVLTEDGSARFVWRGQSFTVSAARARFADQRVDNLTVTLNNMFSPDPTHVLVSGTLTGGVEGVLAELRKLDDQGEVPRRSSGTHVTALAVDVPLPHGRDASFHESTVTVSSTLKDVEVAGLEELGDEVFSASLARVTMFPDKSLRIVADGRLGGNPLKVTWQKGLDDEVPSEMFLNVDGTVDARWLLARAGKPEGISVTGVVGLAANLVKGTSGNWRFGVKANGDKASANIASLAYAKKSGEPFALEAQGVYGVSGTVRVDALKVKGARANVAGSFAYNSARPDDLEVRLNPLVLGGTDVSVNYAKRVARVSGRRLDVSGIDLFGGDRDEASSIRNVTADLQVDELKMEGGGLKNVIAQLTASDGRWDIQRFTGNLVGGSSVSIRLVPLKGQGGRRKLTLNIDDLGATLSTLGMYERLKGGKMWGDIVYDSRQVGSGVLKMSHFELDNPPVLVKLLSLVSLQQLLAGTDSVLFSSAVLPVRIDGDRVSLDKANFEGPSMSIRLDGDYYRDRGELDFDGRLAPAIPLNRLVSKIPLVGTLLTGSQDGVLVADFKLKGKSSDPDINVRPLSVLTPGLVKDFWRGLTGSEREGNGSSHGEGRKNLP